MLFRLVSSIRITGYLNANARKRMDVQSAISEYYSLSPKIFHQSPMRFLGSNIAKTAIGMPWFEGEALEDGVKRIVKGRISWREREILGADAHDAPLLSSVESTRESSCKTYVLYHFNDLDL
jgi:hypothetical protein